MKKFPYFLTFFIMIAILLCLSVGYLISTVLVTTNLFQTALKIEQQATYHLLSIYQSENKENCEKLKSEFQKKNCAGYIYEEDGTFHIIASIYDNKNDAELVKNRLILDGFDAKILNYSENSHTFEGNFSQKESEVLKDCLQAKNNIYKSLYDISVSLDTNLYDELTAKFNVNEVYSKFLTTKGNFETLFKDKSSFKGIREEFNLIKDELENLSKVETNFSQSVKLAYCNIVLG